MYLQGCELPKLISIQNQVKDIQQCNDTRQNLLVVSIHGQIYKNIEILHAYHCFANTDTLLPFQVHDANARKSMSKGSLETDIFDITTIYGIAENDWLYICAFFYKYPSVLFGSMSNYETDHSTTTTTDRSSGQPQWPNIHTFVKAVTKKHVEIQQLFSDTLIYSNIVAVLQSTLTNDNIIEAEFKVLMNCDKLQILASDVTKFRMVKLLYDYSQPIQSFVETCVRQKFCLVNNHNATD